MDAELKDNICGKKDMVNSATTRSQAFVGNPSSAMNSIQTQRLNNQGCSDKLTQLINMSRDSDPGGTEETQEGSHVMHEQSETTSVNRRYNFNNRDMELSLSGSDEEDDDDEDDEEDGQDQHDDGVVHQHQHQQRDDEQHHDGDYGDIQFFHHKLLLQQHLGHNDFGIGSSVSSFGSPNGLVNIRGGGVDSFHIEECDDNGIGNSFSENPFVFPDNVMEYGEPQFFPGNCVGYLETILEETDEEFEEEEGCSGRHWWTADSDTDTDSVIRVDNGQKHHNQLNNTNHSTVQSAAACNSSGGAMTNLKAIENMEDLSVQSTFRSSASSRPFELEDLHLLDQLDLAFEETLMEPRRRSGFAAFGHQLHLLDQPLETNKQVRGKNLQMSPFGLKDDDKLRSGERSTILQRSSSLDDDRSSKVFTQENIETHLKKEAELISYGDEAKTDENKKLGNAESKETFGSSLSPSSSDSEPHEVAEEDFFYSSPGSESEEGSSSDDSEKNGDGGVVLAEFSLSQAGGGLGNNNSGMLFGSARNRRSFESPLSSSKLKSFRSFDSLNSLSGTELLFSKADTFPSFHYIKEDPEPVSSGSGSPSSPRCNLNLSSSSTNDVPGANGTGREASGAGGVDRRDCCGECEDESQSLPSHPSVGFPPTFNKITKKNSYSSSSTSTASSCNSASGMMSTENLSEDSGIGIGPDGASTLHPVLMGKQSSESFSDEGPDHHHHHTHPSQDQQEEESAKDYIAKTEFALNPMVFSSLSSNDTNNSNSPSMNSIPSLNNQESPSSDLTSDPETPDLFGEVKGKAEYHPERSNPSIYPYGVLNNDTTSSHNSLLHSHLGKVDEESASLDTPEHEGIRLEKSYPEDDEEGSNQILDNPLEEKCPISINNASSPAKIASINDDPQPIFTIKESSRLHPNSDSQIQTKPSISSTDKADEANTPGEDNNKSLDNIRDNRKSNNPPDVASMDSGEKTNTINTNVPLHSSDSAAAQLPSTLALTSRPERVHCDCDCEPQSQQISPEIPSACCNSKPDIVLVEPTSNADYLPKALDSNDSIINTNANEDTIIIISASSENQNQSQPHCVGVTVSGGVPYIEENEIQEPTTTNNPNPTRRKDKDGWNVNETLERQLTSSPSPPPSPSLISRGSQALEFDEDPDPSDYGHMASVNSGDGYQYPYQLDHHPYRRERSSSESEFESAESAVEEDSIALAYAIVNSPTKGSTSSSPTQELNGTNVNNLDANVDSNRESGLVSTLMSLPMACEEDYGKGDGMQTEERVMMVTREVFASPSTSCVDDNIDIAIAGSGTGTGQDGQTAFNANNDNNSTADIRGMKNASLLLHHHEQNEVPEEPQTHYSNPSNTINISPNNTTNSTITYQVLPEPVGHELLASRSVTLDKSSSTDVVHHIHQGVREEAQQHLQLQHQHSRRGTEVDKHLHYHRPNFNQVDYIEAKEDEAVLVIAKPIDPVHIGVAEVKKFSQLDSSVSRKPHHHHLPYQTHGESESEKSRPAPRDTTSNGSDEAILGHSNFGFFGRSSGGGVAGSVGSRSSSVGKSPPTSIVNLDPKSSVGSGSSGSTVTKSSELSYGFPSPCPYPISETDLQLHEGQDWKEITSGGTCRRNRDQPQPKDQQRPHLHRLHLEDIKCGIHPDNFTIPLGAYTAAVVAVAPSIPSKRLIFVNEGEQLIRIHEESSILKEKIGRDRLPSSSLGIPTIQTSSSGNKKPNPTNGTGNASASGSPAVPDILVVKQTHLLQGSEGDKKEAKALPRSNINTTHTRMEVDTSNSPIGVGGGGGDRRSTSPSGIPIKTRTYGGVEVLLVSSRTPSPAPGGGGGNFPQASSLRQHQPSTSSSLGEDGNNEEKENACPDPPAKGPRTRVHFSPVVSEISWRESYIDQSSEFSGSTEDMNTKIGEVNQGDFIKSGATTIPASHRDNGGYHPLNASVTDSVVRPLNISSDQMSHHHAGGEPVVRQPSPGSGKGPILVEKVQMRSSFLQGGDEDDENDELERKLTMDIHITDNRQGCKSPVDEDYLDEAFSEDRPYPHKENVEFRTGAPSASNRMKVENGNGLLDLYEDVSVEIEPINKKSGSTTLSMVPDLLSQCENANNAQTHIDVRIEEVAPTKHQSRTVRKSHSPTPPSQSEIPPPPTIGMEVQQQQIFPKIFAEDGSSKGSKNDSKNNSSSSLNKTKKTSKGFSLGSSGKKAGENPKDKDNKETNGNRETEASKDNKAKANKPGFFERLSKIRLSGGKAKKQKVHPKTDDFDQPREGQPLRTVTVNLNGNSTIIGPNATSTPNPPGQVKKVQQPILKKSPANGPTPILLNYSANDTDDETEPNESHEAFESILDEIAGIKGIQMRMEKTTNGNGTTSPGKPSPPVKELRSFAKRKQFYSEPPSASPPVSPNGRSSSDLDKKLTQFKEETSRTRDAVSKSHPDLELIEDSVRQHSASPEPPKVLSQGSKSPESKKSPKKSSNSETGQKNEREWYKLLKTAAEKYYYRGSSKDDNKEKGSSTTSFKTGIVETDLDTGASREMLDAEIVELDRVPSYTVSTSEIPSASGPCITTTAGSPGTAAKARSLTNLSTRLPLSVAPSNYNDDGSLAQGDLNDFDERARSYEFLLDDNQKSASVPPENKLRFESRQLSEHELRIQRSLQRINVPEWFKNHETASRTCSPANGPSSATDKTGTLQLLRRSEYGSSGGLAGGWAGLSAFKAPSMSSLQSSNGGRYSGSLNRSNFIRGRPATMSATRLSKESLAGSGSASHSPSAFDRCSFTYGMPFAMTRFSHGRMSNTSGSVTPTSTPDSSLPSTTTPSYVKKPYLGWRSQERLNTLSAAGGPPKLSVYLPPEERLAADLMKSKITIRPPISDRPPLPKPPPRSEKTALSKTASNDNQKRTNSPSVSTTKNSSVAVVTKINQTNSIPPPNYSDDEQSSSACREKTSDVHDSIREVTKAISQFVAKGEEEAPKPQPRKKSGKKSIWIESSFVGRKPVSK